MSWSNLAPIGPSPPFAPWDVRYDPFGLNATETAGPSLNFWWSSQRVRLFDDEVIAALSFTY